MAPAPHKLGPGDDAEMIASPDLWPTWPYLPMKNPRQRIAGGWPKAGFFYNPSTVSNTVMFYVGTIFDVSAAVKTELSADEVLAAGWIVD